MDGAKTAPKKILHFHKIAHTCVCVSAEEDGILFKKKQLFKKNIYKEMFLKGSLYSWMFCC